MAIIGTFIQQPNDVLDYDIPYELVAGDSLASAVATATPAGLVVDDPPTIDGNRVKVWLSGGTHGVTYKVEVTTTTAQGRVKQDEIRLKVREY